MEGWSLTSRSYHEKKQDQSGYTKKENSIKGLFMRFEDIEFVFVIIFKVSWGSLLLPFMI